MTDFEFVFSLFGLLLGLSLAEVLGGLARTLKARRKVRIGWLTPALGVMLIVDLVSFWRTMWGERDSIPVTFGTMLFGAAIAGIYYLAASLVFPTELDEWTDLDSYYFEHKKQVVGAVMACNLLVVAGLVMLHGNIFRSPAVAVSVSLFTATAIALILARGVRLNLALLGVMLALYWLGWLVLTLIGA